MKLGSTGLSLRTSSVSLETSPSTILKSSLWRSACMLGDCSTSDALRLLLKVVSGISASPLR